MFLSLFMTAMGHIKKEVLTKDDIPVKEIYFMIFSNDLSSTV